MSHDPSTILRVTGTGELLAEAEARGWKHPLGDVSTCVWNEDSAEAASQSALDYLVDDLGFTVVYKDFGRAA